MRNIDPSRTAVVLGSSFLGVYAHAGFLNGLDEAGFEPGRVAGASAGALAGGLYAAGLRGGRLRDAALDRVLRRSFVDAGAVLRLAGVVTSLWSSGLFDGRKTINHLRGLLGDVDMEDLDVPLDVAVTDADRSEPEIRRNGPLAELMMASCAVPGLFMIQQVGGKRYLDGGIAGELPFGHLIDDPSVDTLILHRIRHERSAPGARRDTSSTVMRRVLRTARDEFHDLRMARARGAGKRVVEVLTRTPFPGLFTHKLAAVCYECGLASGRSLAAAD